MKTIKSGLQVLLALVVISTLSCKKDTGSRSQIPQDNNNIISSNWFYINDWIPEQGTNGEQQSFYIKYLPAASANLEIGKILVLGKYEFGTVTTLPFIFDRTAFGVEKQPGNLKFLIIFSRGFCVSAFGVSFRYILIPEDKLSPHLNYNDYNEVCNYYSIPG